MNWFYVYLTWSIFACLSLLVLLIAAIRRRALTSDDLPRGLRKATGFIIFAVCPVHLIHLATQSHSIHWTPSVILNLITALLGTTLLVLMTFGNFRAPLEFDPRLLKKMRKSQTPRPR